MQRIKRLLEEIQKDIQGEVVRNYNIDHLQMNIR